MSRDTWNNIVSCHSSWLPSRTRWSCFLDESCMPLAWYLTIKLELTWKLPSWWLPFIVPEVIIQTAWEQGISVLTQLSITQCVRPTCLVRWVHLCNSNIATTGHLSWGFISVRRDHDNSNSYKQIKIFNSDWSTVSEILFIIVMVTKMASETCSIGKSPYLVMETWRNNSNKNLDGEIIVHSKNWWLLVS